MIRIRTLSSSLLLAAGLALALAACGGSNAASVSTDQGASSSGGAQSTSTQAATSTTAGTPTDTSSTSTTATTSTTGSGSGSGSGGAGLPTGGGVAGACTSSDLTPAFLNSNGAAGHVVIAFVLKNTGSSTCHTFGFPGVEFLTQSGAPISTDATRTTTDFAGTLPEKEVSIAPGSEASFRMVTSDVASSQNACQNARGLQIYAPDDTVAMKVTMPEAIAVCDGKATVSPVVAGTGASST